MAEKLASINEAAAYGWERLRKPIWANPLDHLKIDLMAGSVGPWAHLYCPFNQECNGRDPVDILWIMYEDRDKRMWVKYEGPLPDSHEYKNDVAKYSRFSEPKP